MAIDLYFRATSFDALVKLGVEHGFMNALGHTYPGVDIEVIPPGEFVVVPATTVDTYDKDGNEIWTVTPGVVDQVNWYFNVRFTGEMEDQVKAITAKLAPRSAMEPAKVELELEEAAEVVEEKTVIEEAMAVKGELTEKVSLYPGGEARMTYTQVVEGGAEIELIPTPKFPKRVWF